jgi:molecular chaperone DnaJ
MKNYYEILGLQKGASKEEIKKAFHKLAHQHHPDKKGGDEAKFKEINEAYQILSDDQKRAQYDQFGSYNGSGGGAGGFNGGGFDFSGFQNGQGFDFDLGDIFGDIFGGGGRSRGPKRGRDISVDIQISFADSIFGIERKISISKVGSCDTCGGSGAEPNSGFKKCSTCNGQGQIRENKRTVFGTFASTRECDTCHGTGEVPDKKCHTCHGEGVVKKNEEMKVAIPAGIESGQMIRLSGKGEAVPHGVPGDLYLKIYVEKDPIFHRANQNIEMDLDIKLTEGLLGGEREIKTLDGSMTITIPTGISSGEILRVRGKGVPSRSGKRGDLLIKIVIKTPAKLSKNARKLIDDLKAEGL